MRDEYNGALRRFSNLQKISLATGRRHGYAALQKAYPSVCSKIGNQFLGMMMYLVPPYAVGERGHVCIIAIYEYPGVFLFEKRWK